MRNMHYKNKNFRLSEELHENLKNSKPKDLSWNQFFLSLMKGWEKHNKKTKDKMRLEK